MLDYTKEDLIELGAEITTREIYQQPQVWQTAFENYKAQGYFDRGWDISLCRRYPFALFQKDLR